MTYRITGRSTEFRGRHATKSTGVFSFHIASGNSDGVDLANTHAVLCGAFGTKPWTTGGFEAVLILDANATRPQREALKGILTGKMGGDAAGLAGLITDFKGVLEAPITYKHHHGHITVSAGNLVQAEGKTFRAANGQRAWLKNAIYPVPDVRAGKSSKVKVAVAGLAYEPPDAEGFWTGPFDMKGSSASGNPAATGWLDRALAAARAQLGMSRVAKTRPGRNAIPIETPDMPAAKQHLYDAEQRVARQREVVDQLSRDGLDTTMAEAILATYMDVLFVRRAMLSRQEAEALGKLSWQPIATAPIDTALEVAVNGPSGEPALAFAYIRVPDGWINMETDEPLDSRPTHWRLWTEPTD